MKTAEILRRFIDAIPLSMHVINPEGRIVDVNRAFLIHFGRTREDVQGQPLKQVMNSMIYFDRGKMRADEPWELETPAALEVLKTHLPSSATFHQGQSTAMARPVPIRVPTLAMPPANICASRCSGSRKPVPAPPGCQALSWKPSRMPPA